MAHNKFKYSTLAASVALTFGLAGCHSGSGGFDDSVVVPTPQPPVSKSGTANFGVELSGLAVKGTMAKSMVSVYTLDANGEMVPLAFRLASSDADESYSVEAPAGTSDSDLDAMIAANVLAASPTGVRTGDDGSYHIYLENSFSGAVVVKVTSSASDSENWVRCDAYTGCGMYEPGFATVLPNDGDLNIEFGEWYKPDLELSTTKFIPAASTTNSTNASSAIVSRSFIANITILTSLASKILQDGAAEFGVDDEQIAKASLKTILQLFGPDGVANASALLADLSEGGAIDLSDIGDNEDLDAGTLALIQLAASFQTIAGNGDITGLINQVATAVSNGDLSSNEANSVLAGSIQQAVTNLAAVFVAVVSGDTTGLDADLVARVQASIDQAMANETLDQADLLATAQEVQMMLNNLGCTGDGCTATADLYLGVATKVQAGIDAGTASLGSLSQAISGATQSIADATAMAAGVNDVDSAVAYYEAVLSAYHMVFNADGKNLLSTKAKKLTKSAKKLVKTSTFLVSVDNQYQELLTSANDLADNIATESAKVTGVHADAIALLADAMAKLQANNATVKAAESKAMNALTMAQAKATMSTDAYSNANSLFDQAMGMKNPMSVADAAAFLAAAENAVTAQTQFISAANMFVQYAEMALADANAFAAVASTNDEQTLAQQMKMDAMALVDTANMHKQWAHRTENGGMKERVDLVAEAKAAKVIIDKLPDVKAATQSFMDISVVTAQGRNALVILAQTLEDVLKEAVRNTTAVSDVPSTTHDGWTYSYDVTNMTLSAMKDGEGSFSAAMEILASDGSTTKAVIALGASLTMAGTGGATFELATGNLNECATAVENDVPDPTLTGSCMVFEFAGDQGNVDAIKAAKVVSSGSKSKLTLVDGDTGFDGWMTHSHNDHPLVDGQVDASGLTSETEFGMKGMSGDVKFDVMFRTEKVGVEAAHMVDLTIGDNGYHMALSAMNDDDLMGSVTMGGYVYGDAMELPRGLRVSYIDGDVMNYDGLSFTAGQF